MKVNVWRGLHGWHLVGRPALSAGWIPLIWCSWKKHSVGPLKSCFFAPWQKQCFSTIESHYTAQLLDPFGLAKHFCLKGSRVRTGIVFTTFAKPAPFDFFLQSYLELQVHQQKSDHLDVLGRDCPSSQWNTSVHSECRSGKRCLDTWRLPCSGRNCLRTLHAKS